MAGDVQCARKERYVQAAGSGAVAHWFVVVVCQREREGRVTEVAASTNPACACYNRSSYMLRAAAATSSVDPRAAGAPPRALGQQA